MGGSSIGRGRGRGRRRPRKTICETIRRDLNVNGLNINMIFDRILWHRLIHVANSI